MAAENPGKAVFAKILDILDKEYPGFPSHYKEEPFRSLIGTVLSQRTRDEVTVKVSETLFKVANTPEKMEKISVSKIKELIKPINFYKTKARRIQKISRILARDYNGKVPKTREELMKLPGVGKKTADCVLSFSYGKQAIPIDTHVEVMAKRLGIADKKDGYDEIQEKLYSIVPIGKRNMINFLFVEHGKKVCTSFRPKHEKCAIRKYCIYYCSVAGKKQKN